MVTNVAENMASCRENTGGQWVMQHLSSPLLLKSCDFYGMDGQVSNRDRNRLVFNHHISRVL